MTKQKNLTTLFFSRREFMTKSLGGLTAGMVAGVPSIIRGAEDTQRRIPLAVQLFSVHDVAAKDLAGTLKELANWGVKGVEFAGTYGYDPEEIRQLLEETGLVAVGAHLSLTDILGDAFFATVRCYKTFRTGALIVTGGMGNALASDGGNQFAAYLFSELNRKAVGAGFRLGFHSHAVDFVTMEDGSSAWDLFFSRSTPDLIAEMDVGNALDSGGDPYSSMEKFPGQGRLIHLKASKPDGTLIGGAGDEVDWQRVFQICENVAGTKWYIVEQEGGGPETDSMNALYQSIENLRKIHSFA